MGDVTALSHVFLSAAVGMVLGFAFGVFIERVRHINFDVPPERLRKDG